MAAVDSATSMFSSSMLTEAPLRTDLRIKPLTQTSSTNDTKASTFGQRALLVTHERKYQLVHDFPTSRRLQEHEVMIRTCAVGLNQIDYKSVDYNFCLPQLPWITGREMAGVVETVGSSVRRVRPGQRVWTSTYYRDRRAGCFQDFVIVPQHTVSPIAPEMPFTDAACLGVCGLTAAMTLWRWFDVPLPHDMPATPPATPTEESADASFMLVWGGSSVTAQFLIQLAKRSVLRVIAVASSKVEQKLLSLGAEHIVVRDGKSNDEIVEEITQYAGDAVVMGVDLVGATTSTAMLKCLSRTRKVRFAPLAWVPNADVPGNVRVLNVEMKQFVLDPSSAIYADQLTRMVENGEVQLPEIEVLQGGLHAIADGLDRLKRGDMAGKKLIVSMLD